MWYSLRKISFTELTDYFKNANYYWIGLGVFLGLLSHLSRAYRWKYMIEPLGHELRFSNSVMAVFSAYLINYTIPRAGEVSRATILSNYEKVPFEKGFGTIVAERVADVLVMMLIIGFTLIWQFEIIFDFLFKDFNFKSDWLPIIPVLSFLIYGGYLILKKSNDYACSIVGEALIRSRGQEAQELAINYFQDRAWNTSLLGKNRAY